MRVSVIMARRGGSRRKKPCACCKKYLDHLDGKNQPVSYFISVMDANSKHSLVSLISWSAPTYCFFRFVLYDWYVGTSKWILALSQQELPLFYYLHQNLLLWLLQIVPNKLVQRFAGKLLGRIINLESPNGSLYDVEVTERYNKTVLQRGWKTFVHANHIQENDFMLFRHIEKTCFEVLILDSDGCEKVLPCAGVRNSPSIQEQSLDSAGISRSSCRDTTESSGSERFARRALGRSSSSYRGRTAKMAATSSSFEESGYAVNLVAILPRVLCYLYR